MPYILETHEITKVYGQKPAVKDVSLHIAEGQIYGLIGRNGAGKTTIMRMISGLSAPTRGSYSLFGKTGPEMRKLVRQVGVLIEYPGLYPKLSAFENLKIKCIAMGIGGNEHAERLLKLSGLENTGKKPTASFSLGMKQRLGIALALVGDPKLIILDEPINGLDPQGIAEVRETLIRLRDDKGITIMISSHILDELAKVADAFGIIHEGELLDEFTAAELHRRCGQNIKIRTGNNAAAAAVLRGMGIEAQASEHADCITVYEHLDDSPAMAKAIVNAGIDLSEIYLRSVSLEDYFLGVTGGKHNG